MNSDEALPNPITPTTKAFGVLFRTVSYVLALTVIQLYVHPTDITQKPLSEITLANLFAVIWSFAASMYIMFAFFRFEKVEFQLWAQAGWVLVIVLGGLALFLQ
jgi:hypothetical protein